MGGSHGPIRGRGASLDLKNRFERLEYAPDPDAPDDERPRPVTQFFRDVSKSIISENDSPDVGMMTSINPYRGCEHGCVYCFARPFHEYLGMSCGLDFETKIMVKEDAPELLRDAMMSSRWTPRTVMMSGVTDCYQPIERKLRITRRCLEVFAEFRNPVAIVTKNRLVTRDLDVLSELARFNAAAVFVSVTTLDLSLNRALEPRTSSPEQRLEAIRKLASAGVPAGVMVAPVIPGLTDHEMPSILEAAAAAGARAAGFVVLRLPYGVAPLFVRWLEDYFPLKKDKVLNRIRSMRGGRLYDSTYGKRMRGEGIHAEQIETMFRVATRKYGLVERPELSTEHFRRPWREGGQGDLFTT